MSGSKFVAGGYGQPSAQSALTGGMVTGTRAPPLYEGKEGAYCYNGDPLYYEEYEERTRLKFSGLIGDTDEKTAQLQRSFLTKVKGGLFGRAWHKCRTHKDLESSRLTDDTRHPPAVFEAMLAAIKAQTQDIATSQEETLQGVFPEWLPAEGCRD